MITIEVSKVLYPSGWLPYCVESKGVQIRGKETYHTLQNIKEYYGIKKMKKIDIGWVVNPRGRRITWQKYEAEISDDFAIKQPDL